MPLTQEQRRIIDDAFADLDLAPDGTILNPVLQTYAVRRGLTMDEVNDAIAAALDDGFIEAVPGPPPGYKLTE